MKTTPKKKRANRANAKKSTGPKSPRGKAVVAKNSLVHGLRTLDPVLPGVESRAEWEAHRRAIVNRLAPEGALEASLAEQIALGYWRLGRCARNEVECVNALRDQARWKAVRMALTHEESRGEGLSEAFRRLEEAANKDQCLATLWDWLLDGADDDWQIDADEANILLEDAVKSASWANLAGLFHEAFSWPPANSGELLAMLEWCGTRIYKNPDSWMRGKQFEARERARKSKGRVVWIHQAADAEVALAVLDPRLTATLQRYETAIHRSLHRDLHELQRIQAMRLGVSQSIPTAIDISVD